MKKSQGAFLYKGDGGPTLRSLPRAVQQLKMLPREDTESCLWTR